MNHFLQSIRPHMTRQISDATAHDPEIINLLVGELPYEPPRQILETLAALLTAPNQAALPAQHRYAHSRGAPALRHAIAKRYHRLYGLAVHPDTQLLVTHGATEAVWLAIFTLTNLGDEVIIPDPCYMIYEPIVVSLGRCPVRVPTSEEVGFRLDPARLLRALTSRTRLLVLNSPENPTGAIYDRTTLAEILALAQDHSFYLLHDEVYDAFAYVGEHIPALMLDPDASRTVMVNSLSKRFGIGGWRLGWLVAAPDVVVQAAKAHSYVTMMANTLLQEAVADAINDRDIECEIANRAVTLRQRGQLLLQGLRGMEGFSYPTDTPRGGFYAFIRVTDLYRKLTRSTDPSQSVGEVVAHYLLEMCKVAVVPGIGFGTAGADHVRISFAAPEAQLTTAINRFRAVLQ